MNHQFPIRKQYDVRIGGMKIYLVFLIVCVIILACAWMFNRRVQGNIQEHFTEKQIQRAFYKPFFYDPDEYIDRGGFPAWHDHQIYDKLSKRIKIGIWKGWININGLAFMDELTNITNCEVKLYNNNDEVMKALFISKEVDVVMATEADYGFYLFNELQMQTPYEDLQMSKDFALSRKKQIQEKFPARLVYAFYPVYRVFIANYETIPINRFLPNKTIEITNITNPIYVLDEFLLQHIKYTKVYRDSDRGTDKFGSYNRVDKNIDGYFSQFDNPNSSLKEFVENKAITLIDMWSDGNTTNFQHRKEMKNKYFFIEDYVMDLKYYPELVQRRKQAIEYYGDESKFNPSKLKTYGFKTIMLTRDDIEDEWIYQFTKDIYTKLPKIIQDIPYFAETVTSKSLFKSSMELITPFHRAVYGLGSK
jgi:hypothetical protein